jgi:hypothetical protein
MGGYVPHFLPATIAISTKISIARIANYNGEQRTGSKIFSYDTPYRDEKKRR